MQIQNNSNNGSRNLLNIDTKRQIMNIFNLSSFRLKKHTKKWNEMKCNKQSRMMKSDVEHRINQ